MTSIVDLHNIVPVVPQIMSDPQYVFITPLTPKEDEGWLSLLKAIGPIILSAITTFVAVGQFRISRAQHALSQQQITIAASQKEIAEDKHRLELFEKRFETYEIFLNMALWATKINIVHLDVDSKFNESKIAEEKFNENKDKLISIGEQSRFIFSEEIYTTLSEARKDIFQLVYYTENLRSSSDALDEENKNNAYQERRSDLFECRRKCVYSVGDLYTKKLAEIMGPYLKMAPYLSKD